MPPQRTVTEMQSDVRKIFNTMMYFAHFVSWGDRTVPLCGISGLDVDLKNFIDTAPHPPIMSFFLVVAPNLAIFGLEYRDFLLNCIGSVVDCQTNPLMTPLIPVVIMSTMQVKTLLKNMTGSRSIEMDFMAAYDALYRPTNAAEAVQIDVMKLLVNVETFAVLACDRSASIGLLNLFYMVVNCLMGRDAEMGARVRCIPGIMMKDLRIEVVNVMSHYDRRRDFFKSFVFDN